MGNLHEITLEEMRKALNGTYNVESTDTNVISVSFFGATVEVSTEFKDSGEITIFKPGALCEVRIDCEDILDGIETDDNGYFILSFNNGMSDIEIKAV